MTITIIIIASLSLNVGKSDLMVSLKISKIFLMEYIQVIMIAFWFPTSKSTTDLTSQQHNAKFDFISHYHFK